MRQRFPFWSTASVAAILSLATLSCGQPPAPEESSVERSGPEFGA